MENHTVIIIEAHDFTHTCKLTIRQDGLNLPWRLLDVFVNSVSIYAPQPNRMHIHGERWGF